MQLNPFFLILPKFDGSKQAKIFGNAIYFGKSEINLK